MSQSLCTDLVGGVLTLRLNRPGQMNALDSELIAALGDEIASASLNRDVRVLLLTGSGSAFCAGADLDEARGLSKDPKDFETWLYSWKKTFSRLETIGKPTLAVVDGWALAGGLELALACDIVIASESSRLGDVHIRHGLVPGGGGTVRLPDAVGRRVARWLMFTGAIITAREAMGIGLVQAVFSDDEFNVKVQELAAGISRASAPALAFMKEMTRVGGDTSDLLSAEIDQGVLILCGIDAKEGLESFVGKRTPRFSEAPLSVELP
ncbi:MAG: enoyl-CoA hydratase/isomerase family protein [Actinobacteria bacterium]|nr:enoyl-CoA hydratase/isomerase family protein [Actinomycetota bacterium]